MNKWLEMGLNVAEFVASRNPIASVVITSIKAVVEKANDGITDKSVKEVLEEMALSKYNSLNDNKLRRIIEIINE